MIGRWLLTLYIRFLIRLSPADLASQGSQVLCNASSERQRQD